MKKYRIIYADPPWKYNDRKIIRKDGKKPKAGIGACNHYDLMSLSDICKLPVSELAANNCALFLWCPGPHIPAVKKVMDAWGFRYVNFGFLWLKVTKNGNPFFGVGYYTKSNPEPCFLGIRGKMKPVSNCISQVIIAPHPRNNGKIIHSAKPPVIRDKIVQLFGDLPRIELFAREKVPGWDVWGNEVRSDIELEIV